MPRRDFFRGRSRRRKRKYCEENSERSKNEQFSKKIKLERKYPIGVKNLESLLNKHSDEIVLELLRENSGYLLMIKEEDIKLNKFNLLFDVLSLAVETKSNKQNLGDLLSSTFVPVFCNRLLTFIMKIYSQSDFVPFLAKLIFVLKMYVHNRPSEAVERVEEILNLCKMLLKSKGDLEDGITIALETDNLLNHVEDTKKKFSEDKNKEKVKKECGYDDELPPEDYRTLSVVPTSQDINTNERVYLRKNIIKGKFLNADHYLDIQFRLLREDFVRPLRRGIHDFRSNDKKSKNSDLRIYKNVKFTNYSIIQKEFMHIVKLSNKINLENSKQLMYGNLVCFSSDNFKTIILGQILYKDKDLLNKQSFGVKFDSDETKIDYDKVYVMAESRSYFIAYKYVLIALQQLNENNIPFQDYLLYAKADIDFPSYVNDLTTYDLNTVVFHDLMNKSEKESKIFPKENEIHSEEIAPHDFLKDINISKNLDDWPSKDELQLDITQRKAFKNALTNELSIIQGPPGTGKTFLGLRIAQTLLHNSEYWKIDGEKSPILVVCYTNHALDQFLEGMLKFTENIIRVGSRSKNEELSKYQINNVLHYLKRRRAVPQSIHGRNENLYSELLIYEQDIRKLTDIVNEYDNLKGILSFKVFENSYLYRTKHYISQLKGRTVSEWLLQYSSHCDGTFDYARLGSRNDTFDGDEDLFNDALNFVEDLEHDRKLNEEIYDTFDGDEDLFNDALNFVEDLEHDRKLNEEIYDNENFEINLSELICYDITLDQLEMEMHNQQSRNMTDIMLFQYQALEIGLSMKPDEDKVKKIEKYTNLNLWTLQYPERWNLYQSWVKLLKKQALEKISKQRLEYSEKSKSLKEMNGQAYLHIMRGTSVVGMTTTGAAQYCHLIQDLAPKIVIVEEAAEILEAHLVTALSASTKHLILIGDHQQLRPNPTVYELATKFGLEISMFERLVKNGLSYSMLEYQHRMRPSISEIMRLPLLYPDLKDDVSVKSYAEVKGLLHSLYFVDHQINEDKEKEGNSYKNLHEAEMAVALARYLVMQGYKGSEITILTPYVGQLFLLKKIQRLHLVCSNVPISVVDNFQGEENRIIILSLVRSNEEGKIGFLKTDNRVCVALSRAQEGLFILGNMQQLCKSSELWSSVNDHLFSKNIIGPELPLKCQNHPDELTLVKTSQEIYSKSPEGGCLKNCPSVLHCGHQCPKLCHTVTDHKDVKCPQPCKRIMCENEHICKKECWQDCGKCAVKVQKKLPCGHEHAVTCSLNVEDFQCPSKVDKQLPHCNHIASVACFSDVVKVKCKVKCDSRLDCGHECPKLCHVLDDPEHDLYKCLKPCYRTNQNCSLNHPCKKRCSENCNECRKIITKTLSCGHEAKNVFCGEKNIQCLKLCLKTLPCSHKCRNKCHEKCECKQKVSKMAECNHEVELLCSIAPSSQYCQKNCAKVLECGHQCQNRCKDQCTRPEKCTILVNTSFNCPNNHSLSIPCNKVSRFKNIEEISMNCKEPCNQILSCGHVCYGECGSCYNGRLHKSCKEPCGKVLVCGHVCKEPCSLNCPPCQQKCPLKCEHSKCKKKCGQLCTPCKEKCSRYCEHNGRCVNLCGIPCSTEPCTKPCNKKLECGCICKGFCGEPCPPFCRTHTKADLLMLSGNEDEDDAKIVLLEDCGHFFESEGLEMWLGKENDNTIQMKQCPSCTHPIYNSKRYQKLILTTFEDISRVKKKHYHESLNCKQFFAIRNKYSALVSKQKKIERLQIKEIDFEALIKQFSHSVFCESGKIRRLTQNELVLHSFQGDVLIKSVDMLLKSNQFRELNIDGLSFILRLVMQTKSQISSQLMDEIICEIQRINIMPKLKAIENSNNTQVKNIYQLISEKVNPTVKFSSTLEKEVNNLIKECKKYVGTLEISESERLMVLKAMQLQQGHWYKCPNGHIYCIADCGGATVQSICPDCKCAIGGGNHALLPSNRVATEMDGARHSAWSEQANLGNYRF